jgi:hypothetical protein
MKRKYSVRLILLTACLFLCGLILLRFSTVFAQAAPVANMPEKIGEEAATVPSPEPSPPPAPSPVPSPQPPACNYFQTDMTWSGKYGNDAWTLDKILKRTGDAATLTCLDNLVQQFNTTCKNYVTFGIHFEASPTGNFSKNYDDCFVTQFANYAFPDWNGDNHKIGTHSNGAVCTHLLRTDLWYCPPTKVANNINACHACAEGKFFLNNQCQVVPPNPSLTACGSIVTDYQLSCPVSLLWAGEKDIESQVQVVQFPLDPQGVGRWYEWKASESAPLLVYDPKHEGSITSSSQLFGNWTFGGQRLAALAADGRGIVSGRWENGFEALATLDADGSGALESAELEPLGLWFDKNRNGIADPGEVKTLREAQVTKLYFRHDAANQASGSLRASLGYERMLNGKAVTGASVDWLASSALTPVDLLSSYGKGPLSPPAAKGARLEMNTTPSQTGAAPTRASLSGIWAFRFTDQNNRSKFPAGYLMLSDPLGQDNLTGYSVIDKAFRVNGGQEAFGAVSVFALRGSKKADVTGKYSLSFSVGHDESKLVSEAVVNPELTRMDGESKVQAGSGKTLSYRWQAERL